MVALSSATVAVGDTLAVTGTWFKPNEVIAVMLDPDSAAPVVMGTATADQSGSFTLTFTVQINTAGTYAIEIWDDGENAATPTVTGGTGTAQSAAYTMTANVGTQTWGDNFVILTADGGGRDHAVVPPGTIAATRARWHDRALASGSPARPRGTRDPLTLRRYP